MHQFDEAIQLTGDGAQLVGSTTEPYANMVGPYGGITAAALLNAVLLAPEAEGTPMSMTVSFMAPVSYGSFTVERSLVRRNRSSQHWYVTQSQQGDVVSQATVLMATRRQTWATHDVEAPQLPTDTAPLDTSGAPLPWIKQYAFRGAQFALDGGDAPTASSETVTFVRDEPARPLDYCSLAALGDCFFPRPMVRRNEFVIAGTVTMTHHFHATPTCLESVGDDEVIGRASASRFVDNYCDQRSELWSANGTLLLSSLQTVYYKV